VKEGERRGEEESQGRRKRRGIKREVEGETLEKTIHSKKIRE